MAIFREWTVMSVPCDLKQEEIVPKFEGRSKPHILESYKVNDARNFNYF